MRLVSPAPAVMVPPGAQRTPQAPQIYPPQPQSGQQNLYSTQNGSGIAGKVSTFFFYFLKECCLCALYFYQFSNLFRAKNFYSSQNSIRRNSLYCYVLR